MPRRKNLAAPKPASTKQAKKQLQLQSAQFGELETTPTSHHEQSPIPPMGQKTRATHTDCHGSDQLVDPDEFEDGIDDDDMAKITDTPKQPNTPKVREIVWSEKDSETHRSSSMSSQEEEQSGHVFGYIGGDIPLTSPLSGHDALPDTLPLSAAAGNLPSADCQSQPSQNVDFSETASTIYRSSPFGRSHTSRKSVTTPQPASTQKKLVVDLVDTQLLVPDVLDKDIPGASIDSQTRSDKDSARDVSIPQVAEGAVPLKCRPSPPCGPNLEAGSCDTGKALNLGDTLLDQFTMNRLDTDGDSNSGIHSISCDIKPPKKRKQRPKTPLQFDEDTQEVKSVSRQPLYRKLYKQPFLREEQNAKSQGEARGKKRKSNVSNDNNLRKTVKSVIVECTESSIVSDDTNGQCISQLCIPTPQPPFKDQHNDEMSRNTIEEERQRSQVTSPIPSENNDAGEFETAVIEAMQPQSNHNHPELSPVQITESTEKVGDCIFVATDNTGTYQDNMTAKETQYDFAVVDRHIKGGQSTGVQGGQDVGVSKDNNKKTNSDADITCITRSSSKFVKVEVFRPQLLPKSKAVKQNATDRRISQNFSVSERGSPIPCQQQVDMADASSGKEAIVTPLNQNIRGMIHGRSAVQTCNTTSEKRRSHLQQGDAWAPVKGISESFLKTNLMKHRDHHELLPSILSDIRQIPGKYPAINKTGQAGQSVTTSDRGREQVHELVDVFMKRVDLKRTEILTVADAYKRAGDRCVNKIQSRFRGERRAVFDDATNHARRFQNLVFKGVRLVSSNGGKGSGLMQDLQQTISQRASLYECASSDLQGLYEQLMANAFGEVQNSCSS